MSRTEALKFFVKIFTYPSCTLALRKFSARDSCYRVKEIRCFTSTDVLKPDRSKRSAIEPVDDLDLGDYGSVAMPSFNFAAYADKSPILQELIKLGVNLYVLEKKPNVDYLLTLKKEKIEQYLLFLTHNGVTAERLGDFITLNPFIFKEDLEDMQIRINYLESKKFDKAMISNILVKNPKWLSFPVKTIDERLGFIQQSFEFKGDEVRKIITYCPSLGTIDKKKLIINLYTLKEDLGLDSHAVKKLILSEPKLLRIDPFDLVSTFDYLSKNMNISLDLILKQPKVLTCRKFILKERHLFLKSLGRSQYNCLLPGYVSILELVGSSDEAFCEKIAKTSLKCFEEFLKTL